MPDTGATEGDEFKDAREAHFKDQAIEAADLLRLLGKRRQNTGAAINQPEYMTRGDILPAERDALWARLMELRDKHNTSVKLSHFEFALMSLLEPLFRQGEVQLLAVRAAILVARGYTQDVKDGVDEAVHHIRQVSCIQSETAEDIQRRADAGD